MQGAALAAKGASSRKRAQRIIPKRIYQMFTSPAGPGSMLTSPAGPALMIASTGGPCADHFPGFFRRLFFYSGSCELLRDEPDLELVLAEDFADQQIIGALIAVLVRFLRCIAGFGDDHFMRLEQAEKLNVHRFPSARRA